MVILLHISAFFCRHKVGIKQQNTITTKCDLEDKLQKYNKINGAIRRHFGKQIKKETKLRIHNTTAKAALEFGSEAWVLKKREEQRLGAAEMKFLRHLFGVTKLGREKNQSIRGKMGAQNIVK